MNPAPGWWVEALAGVVYGLRQNEPQAPKWDMAGIKAAINNLASPGHTGTLQGVAAAFIHAATDKTALTPAAVTRADLAWDQQGNGILQDKAGQRQKCPEHHVPLTAGNCQRCIDAASEHIPGRAAQMWADIKHQQRQEDQP